MERRLNLHPRARFYLVRFVSRPPHLAFRVVCMVETKFRGAGDRFGDYLCVDCVILPCISGCNHFMNKKFIRLNTNILKSSCT